MTTEVKQKIYIVGAGPGDPDYLTVKAYRIIREAEVLLYDDLVDERVLNIAPESAVKLYVGRRHGSGTDQKRRQRVIEAGIETNWNERKRIVRLKSGDPLVFSRTAEEINFLLEKDIPFEIIPGITAGFAAASRLKLPLTKRLMARSLVLSLGHTSDENMSHLVSLCPLIKLGNPVMLYMARVKLKKITAVMREQGVPESTRVFACKNISIAGEQFVEGNLDTIHDTIEKTDLTGAVVFIFCRK